MKSFLSAFSWLLLDIPRYPPYPQETIDPQRITTVIEYGSPNIWAVLAIIFAVGIAVFLLYRVMAKHDRENKDESPKEELLS